MPDRRPKRTGSFGGHFDELVKHFTQRTSAAIGKDRSRATG